MKIFLSKSQNGNKVVRSFHHGTINENFYICFITEDEDTGLVKGKQLLEDSCIQYVLKFVENKKSNDREWIKFFIRPDTKEEKDLFNNSMMLRVPGKHCVRYIIVPNFEEKDLKNVKNIVLKK